MELFRIENPQFLINFYVIIRLRVKRKVVLQYLKIVIKFIKKNFLASIIEKNSISFILNKTWHTNKCKTTNNFLNYFFHRKSKWCWNQQREKSTFFSVRSTTREVLTFRKIQEGETTIQVSWTLHPRKTTWLRQDPEVFLTSVASSKLPSNKPISPKIRLTQEKGTFRRKPGIRKTLVFRNLRLNRPLQVFRNRFWNLLRVLKVSMETSNQMVTASRGRSSRASLKWSLLAAPKTPTVRTWKKTRASTIFLILPTWRQRSAWLRHNRAWRHHIRTTCSTEQVLVDRK